MDNRWKPESRATLSPDPMEIAWAAGVFEGEGYVKAVRRRRNGKPMSGFHVVVNVDQKDGWLCPKLRELFGGAVKLRNVKACSPKNPELRRDYYRWQIYGSRALGFVQTIYKFLSPRRQGQVRLVLEALKG